MKSSVSSLSPMLRLYRDDWMLEYLNGHSELQDEILQILGLWIGNTTISANNSRHRLPSPHKIH